MLAPSKNGITPVAVIGVQTRDDNDDKLRLKIISTSEIDEEGTCLTSESMRVWVVKFDGWVFGAGGRNNEPGSWRLGGPGGFWVDGDGGWPVASHRQGWGVAPGGAGGVRRHSLARLVRVGETFDWLADGWGRRTGCRPHFQEGSGRERNRASSPPLLY